MEKLIKLEVTEQEFEILFMALGKVPAEISYNLITKLKLQEQEKKDVDQNS